MAKRTGLGKGLDSLIPMGRSTNNESKKETDSIKNDSSRAIGTNAVEKKSEKNEKKNSTSKDKNKTDDNVIAEVSESEQENTKESLNKNNTEDNNQGIVLIKISQIEPNRNQPRKQFDDEKILELSESLKQYGMIQPLIVQKKGKRFEIIAGERRWRAAKLAKIKEIPVIIKEYTPQEVMEISLIENIQREDLSALEEAEAFQRLIDEFHLTHEELALRVSKSRTAITNSMRLLKLAPRVQEMLTNGELTGGHARALLAITDELKQVEAAGIVIERKLSVRDTEKLVKIILSDKPKAKKKEEDPAKTLVYQNIEKEMREVFGTKVSINRKNDEKGKIEIEYYSIDELERLIALLKK